MAILTVGSGFARVIGMVSIPVLTRMYTPEDFGVMAVFIALVAIVAPLPTLRYVLALPLPRHDGLAMNLMALSAALMLIIGMVLAFTLALFAEPLLTLMSLEVLAPWWWLIVLALIGSGIYEILSFWATRRRAYKAIAHTQISQSAAGAVVKIVFGAFGTGPIGLLVGQVVAQSGGIGTFVRQFLGEWRANWRHVRRSRLKRVAIRHRGFPIYRLPSQFLLVFSQQAPVMFAAALFGVATAGQLGLALAVVALPLSLLGGSLGRALYGEAASISMRDPARLFSMVRLVQIRLFGLALAPATVLFLFGSPIFMLIFGPNWEQAGHFASFLAIYLPFQFTSSPLMQMMNLLNAQHMFLGINALRALSLLGLGYAVSSLELSAKGFVASYSVLAAMTYIAISVYVIHRLRQTMRGQESKDLGYRI